MKKFQFLWIAVPVMAIIFCIVDFMSGLGTGARFALYLVSLYQLVVACFTFGYGIRGRENAGNVEKAQNIIRMGITLFIFRIIQLIAISSVIVINAGQVISVFFGMIMPFLYIVGGNMNKDFSEMNQKHLVHSIVDAETGRLTEQGTIENNNYF